MVMSPGNVNIEKCDPEQALNIEKITLTISRINWRPKKNWLLT